MACPFLLPRKKEGFMRETKKHLKLYMRTALFLFLAAVCAFRAPASVFAGLVPVDPVLPAPLPVVPSFPVETPYAPEPTISDTFSDYDVISSLMEAEGYTVVPSSSGGTSAVPSGDGYMQAAYNAYCSWAADRNLDYTFDSYDEWKAYNDKLYGSGEDSPFYDPSMADGDPRLAAMYYCLAAYYNSMKIRVQDGWAEIDPEMYRILSELQYAGLPDYAKPDISNYPGGEEFPCHRYVHTACELLPNNGSCYISSTADVRIVACSPYEGSFRIYAFTDDGSVDILYTDSNCGYRYDYDPPLSLSESGYYYVDASFFSYNVSMVGDVFIYGADYVFLGTIEEFLGKLKDNPDLWDSPGAQTAIATIPGLGVDVVAANPYPTIDAAVAAGRVKKDGDKYYFPVHDTGVGPDTNTNNRTDIERPLQPDPKPDPKPDPEPGSEPDSEPDSETDPGVLPDIADSVGNWKNLFPFCIPWDIMTMVRMLNTDRAAPKWHFEHEFKTIGSKGLGGGKVIYKLVIDVDMADYWKYIKIFRWGQTVFFIIGLFFLTVKFTTFVHRMS